MKKARIINPFRLPHGWKKQVAVSLSVHPHTVSNALRRGDGDATYHRVVECATALYGKATKQSPQAT
jgi:hypothetical protein